MNIEIKDTLISEEQLQAKVKELALQIERDFEGEEIVVIAVLKGSFVFAADLIRNIKNDVTI
ncbi:phosphoribosyltransferase family protein, partial [Bacillus thuringiensis]|nr:phosphoribosyltransferase family protein [Bacillus thuringiensis]